MFRVGLGLAASGDLVQQSVYHLEACRKRTRSQSVAQQENIFSCCVSRGGKVEICCERLQFVFEKMNTFSDLYDWQENAFWMGTVALYRVYWTGLVDLGFTKLC